MEVFLKVAIIQMTSVLDYKINLDKINYYINIAKNEEKIEYFFLPEVFYSMSNGLEATPHLVEKDNEHYNNIKSLATKNKVHIIAGTASTKVDGKIVNRTYSFDPEGNPYPSYDKIHLFSIHSEKIKINESDIYTSGNKVISFDLDQNWKLGLSTCFDIRFSELYREHFKNEVNVFTCASAFTIPTGKAHWETLLRARAIENQSYMIAANQVGIHNERIKTYGHSMIIDPWGKVLANAYDKEGYIWADLDYIHLEKIRSRIDMSSKDVSLYSK